MDSTGLPGKANLPDIDLILIGGSIWPRTNRLCNCALIAKSYVLMLRTGILLFKGFSFLNWKTHTVILQLNRSVVLNWVTSSWL